MVQSAESRKGANHASGGRAQHRRPTHRRVFSKPQMRPIVVVQVDNLIPILLNCEKSVIRGIRGMGVLSGFMERW